MQRTSPPGLCKAVVCLLIPLVLFTSCSKDYHAGNPQDNVSYYLTGRPTPSVWGLLSIQTGNSVDTTVQGAMKQYFADGTLTDNLGYRGNWEIVAPDSLVEHIQSSLVPNAPSYTNRYHIDLLGTKRMELSYTLSSQIIRLVYVSGK